MSIFRMLPLLLLMNDVTAFSQTPQEPTAAPQTLTVTGRGEVEAEPDQAVVQLGVTQQAQTAREAQRMVNETVNEILGAMDALGIEKSDIQTSQLNLDPVYSDSRVRGQGNERRVTGYRATYSLFVNTQDLERVSDVIDGALEAGANQMRGIRFGLQDEAGPRQEALRLAVSDAAGKAEALAAASSTSIVRVLEIVEGGASVRPGPIVRAGVMAAEAMASPTPVMGGQITVSGQVTIRYEIR